MALRKIIYLPDVRLRQRNLPVTDFGPTLQTLIDDMFETMYEAKGVGLAAPQIGINLQFAVIDVDNDRKKPFVLINPQIVDMHGSIECLEGCLSIPGAYETLARAETTTVSALDRHGKTFEISGDGLLSECLQHEIEHLQGKLFIDKLSTLKQNLVRKKLEKYKRTHSRSS